MEQETKEQRFGLGRPSKYTPEIVEKARAFVEGRKGQFTMIAELALELGVRRSTIYEWCSDPQKHTFSDIVETLMASQEVYLAKGALTGDLNANISKLLLTKHNYSDKQDVTSDNKPLQAGQPVIVKLVGKDDE